MYPADDGPIRLRLLIAQSRAARERLEARVAELRDLQSRRLDAGTTRPSSSAPECEDLGGGDES